jgi:hypothetical protein
MEVSDRSATGQQAQPRERQRGNSRPFESLSEPLRIAASFPMNSQGPLAQVVLEGLVEHDAPSPLPIPSGIKHT